MTCKDCLHYDVCYSRIVFYLDYEDTTGKETNDVELRCSNFNDKSRFIELPCKVVDTVYCIDGDNTISKWYVAGFKKYHNMAWSCDVRDNLNKWNHQDRAILFSAFGKTVFLTRKEAGKALKEREK